MKKILTTLLLLIMGVSFIHSQTVNEISASVENNKIVIDYNLGGDAMAKYKVEVFSSQDNYQKSLKFVSGDVGKNTKVGQKKVTWDYEKEYPGQALNDINFKVVATEQKKTGIVKGILITGGVIGGIIIIGAIIYGYY